MTRPSYSAPNAPSRRVGGSSGPGEARRRALGVLGSLLVACSTVLASCGGLVDDEPSADAGSTTPAPPPKPRRPEPTEETCTRRACTDGMTIELTRGTWERGNYSFLIESENGSAVCEASMPFPPCTQGNPVHCRGTNDEGKLPEVEAVGCVDPEENAFSAIALHDGPSRVTVRIERDGELLAERTFRPSYDFLMPNGPRCAPTCRVAAATWTWDTN